QRRLAALNFTTTEIKLESVLADEAKAKAAEEADQAAAEARAKAEAARAEADAPQQVAADDASSEDAPLDADSANARKAATEVAASDATVEDADAEAEEEEEAPEFDILLRETLRIVTDAIRLEPDPDNWRQPALPLASKSRFEKLVN